ncbi:uncharacterized protein FA14DRAFT_74089 [Meira miltonrushii]|uniref:Uncharacterized protein n=1 Tax=Meira miltonrushii TaxID=1280837 RepID=A0A316VAB4_9BASI|nr:uncharacterized protein FA14DRAFT_74089 [Meira miltonrushii]PWN32445.1 hypothetical protein FA14DRAFT_74089 [Meira miltonrushii]
MSKQEAARAALRSLASPPMKFGGLEEMTGGNSGYSSIHQLNSSPQAYHVSQSQRPTSSSQSSSFFGNGSGSQIMDSPTSSPSLAALQSPPSSYRDSFGTSTQNSRQTYSHGPHPRDGSLGTPGTSEVPSLSLSHSSISDANLLSPYHEGPTSQNNSISSIRTIQAGPHNSSSKRSEAIRRAAASMRIPVEEVQRGMDFVEKVNAGQVDEAKLAGLDEIDREALRRINDAVKSEEDRLAQIASFRAAYLHAESTRPEMELHHSPDPTTSSAPRRTSYQERQSHKHHHTSNRRSNREGMIGMPESSRTMPPLSPPPSYEQLEYMENDHPHHHSMPPAPRSPTVVPSPRAALESLTSAGNRHHPYSQNDGYSSLQRFSFGTNNGSSPYHPSTSQHVRRSSGSRPLSLPDRSYRSMDDYVTDPFRNGPNMSGHLRRSVQAPYPLPSSVSRTASRSPLIGESPRMGGILDVPSSESGNPSSSPLLSTSNRLTPGSHGPQRKRSGSNTSNRSSLISRRASNDVLGLGIPRSVSPLNEYSPSRLSHEEVMARLQKKVKERIAAKEAAIANGSISSSTPTSPAVSMTSLGASAVGNSTGRRRQESQNSNTGVLSPSKSQQRKPRKAVSLKALPRTSRHEDKPLPELPIKGGTSPPPAGEDDQMSGVEQTTPEFDPSASEGRLGIEALLSAAAIADSRA